MRGLEAHVPTGHLSVMRDHEPPQIEMRVDGSFAPPHAPTWPMKLAAGAVVVAVLAGMIALAAVLFWLALVLIPIAFIAGLVAWAAFRFQLWRAGRSFGRGPRDLFRP
jgi:hypothetical protein